MCSIDFAQNKILIDSLLKEVQKTKNDSIKSSRYIDISDEYWYLDPVNCEKYARLGLKHAMKVKSHGLISNAYSNLSSANYFLGNSIKSLQYSKLSYNEAILSKISSKIMRSAGNLGSDYYSAGKYDSAIVVLDNGLEIAFKNKNQNYLSSLNINKGNCLLALTQYDKAEKCYQSALKVAYIIKDTSSIIQCYNNIAALRLNKGIGDSTVINGIMKAIALNEERKDFLTLGHNFSTLAAAYNIQKNDKKTIFYLKKAIATFKIAKNEIQSLSSVISLADQYREMNILDSALVYANEALRIGKSNNYDVGLAAAKTVIGLVESNKSNFIKAENYLKEAYTEFTIYKNGEGIFLAGNALTNVFNKQNKIKEAKVIALQLNYLADSTNNFLQIKNTSSTLAELYHKSGNDSKAYQFLSKSIIAADTIYKMLQTARLDSLEAKYETNKKDLEIVNLRNDKLSREKRIIQLVYLLVFFGILSGLIFYFYRRRAKFRNERSEFILKQKLAQIQQEALNSQMNAHFVSRTMDSINNFVKKNDKDNASEYLLLYNRMTRKVLENSFKKSITISEDIELLNDYIKLEKLRFEDQNLSFRVLIDKDINPDKVMIPPMIFQILMENSIVHGLDKIKGGEITLSIKASNGVLYCSLEDNGIGINPSGNPENGKNQDRKSLGFQLAKRLLELYNDSKNADSFKVGEPLNYESGTRVEFYLNFVATENR